MTDHPHRIAVTGANGFLGRSLCHIAYRRGWQVVAVVRRRYDLTGVTDVITASLTDTHALEEAFRGCTAVVHTAGLAHVVGRAAADEHAFRVSNVLGTKAVASAARAAGVRHLVLASSVSVYGGLDHTAYHHSTTSMSSETDELLPLHPRTAYARSKLESEQVAVKCFADFGCLSVLRLATLYGEGDRGNVARLIESLRRGRFIWPGTGVNCKSLIYKEDAARACIAAVQTPIAGIYNVSAPPVSMLEIVEAICDALNRPVPRVRIPGSMLRVAQHLTGYIGGLKPFERQIRTFLQDDVYPADKFCRSFDWLPEVSLANGIAVQVRALGSQK